MTKTIEKVQKTTTTSNEERLNQLKQLFPECLTEGEVDAVKVMELLNICKEGGGQMSVKSHIALHGQVSVMLFASLTYPPRLH